MIYNKKYDDTNISDILIYSKKLEGKTFKEVLRDDIKDDDEYKKSIAYYNNTRSKGGLGNLLEKYYYGYEINNNPKADFIKANCELKTTPLKMVKNDFKAKERLVLSMIPNNRSIKNDLFNSELIEKIENILLVFYYHDKNIKDNRTSYQIKYVNLYNLFNDKKDLDVIANDYKIITNKIIRGKAHELSEKDTKYLSACTKGNNAKGSIRPQYYNPDIPAKSRAFSFKALYINKIIKNIEKERLILDK